MDSLVLNGNNISYVDIKDGNILGETPFEKSTLSFCRQWLNGKGLFSLKTSGSTGAPKVINVSRYQMKLSARQTIRFFNLSTVDTVLVCLNTAYIAGIMMLVRAFESGAKIIAKEPQSNPLENINEQTDFLAVVPLQLSDILNNPQTKSKLEQCRAAIVGGVSVSVKLEEEIQNSTANIYATFGMTETLTHFALRQLSPINEDSFTALDEVILGQDDRGCLTIASPVTENNVLSTNDQVELISQISFKWLGRIDYVINSGGLKIQIEDLERKIEHAFLDLELDYRFLIGSTADEKLGEKIVLIIECETEIEHLSNMNWTPYFDQFQKPKEIIYLKRFIETPTGKINRQEILNNI
jgi:O-succinylbenzoic acid--CoA ligase